MGTIIMPILQNGEQRLGGNKKKKKLMEDSECYELFEGRIQTQVFLALSPTC